MKKSLDKQLNESDSDEDVVEYENEQAECILRRFEMQHFYETWQNLQISEIQPLLGFSSQLELKKI